MKKFNSWMLFLLMSRLQRSKDAAVKLAKIKAVTYYIKAVNGIRMSLIGVILLFVCLFLLMIGFVGLHIALFAYADWQPDTAKLVLLIISAVYFLIGLGALMSVTSERTWMKFSKGDELTEEALKGE